MTDLIIRTSRRKPLLHVGYGLALLVIGAVIVTSHDPTLEPYLGWLIVAAGIALLARSAFILLDSGAKIILDREGLHLPGPGLGTLEWNEIANAYVEVIRSCCYLHLELRDPVSSLARHPELKGAINRSELEFDVSRYDLKGESIADAIIHARDEKGAEAEEATR